MIGHDDISIQSKLARPPRFIQSRARDDLNCFGAKDWQAVPGYRSEIVTRRVARDYVHEIAGASAGIIRDAAREDIASFFLTEIGGIASGISLRGRPGKAEPYRHVRRQSRIRPLIVHDSS